MYDDRSPAPGRRGSAFEELLRSALVDLTGRRVWILDHEPHGHRGRPRTPDCDGPEISGFRRLLEEGAGHLAAAKEAAREQSRQAAAQARALAAFARCRPSETLDRPESEVGAAAAASRAARPGVLTEVSEWAVDEVTAALGLSSRTAGRLLADSLVLVEQLPATLATLEAAVIGWPQARMLADLLGPLHDEVRAEVEARVLAGAAGRTLAQLRAVARRAVLRADAAAAAQRLASAVRNRAVRLFPDDDGMASLSAVMSAPVAAACYSALEAYAEACVTPGDERTKGQRMVDCLAELILRPGVNGPVQLHLTLVAGLDTVRGGDEPGDVGGMPVPAVLVRELAYTLGLLPRPEPVGPEQAAQPADEPIRSETTASSLPTNEQPAVDLARLLGFPTIAGTALAQVPAIAVVEEISGELLALTHATEIRRIATCDRKTCRSGREPCTHEPCTHKLRGPGLGPPGPSSGYAPADRLADFTRARDRRCRFPGCRARAVRCDLDHNLPWPHGATSADNLCCLCRHHHRLSHQAPGWTMRRLADGGLQWTTPSGDKITTYPPRYGTDDPPPTADPEPIPASPSPRTLRERVTGRPRAPGDADDDPPPF